MPYLLPVYFGVLCPLARSHPAPACPRAGPASPGVPSWPAASAALHLHLGSALPALRWPWKGTPQHCNMNNATWTHTSSSPPLQHPLWSGSRNRSTEEHVRVMQDM